MHVKGYMCEASFTDGVLTVHAHNQMARRAMAGTKKPEDVHKALSGDLVLRRDDMAKVELRAANWVRNGLLTITTTDGNRHLLHFRRKQQAGFQDLAAALDSAL